MTHHPKCEWIRARRELCTCDLIAAEPAENPFARIRQLELELQAWKIRHGRLINQLSVYTGTDAAYALAQEAKSAQELETARRIDDDITDLL